MLAERFFFIYLWVGRAKICTIHRKSTVYRHNMTNIKTVNLAQIKFNEQGTPFSQQFDDVYFSNDDGLAESHYVFIEHNDLPNRWRQLADEPTHTAPFIIAETGFGTGLNFLATWQLYQSIFSTVENPPKLRFISFEKYPLSHSDLTQALSQWPSLTSFTTELLSAYPADIKSDFILSLMDGKVELELIIGDVNDRITELSADTCQVDAWFLDGFAPSKNPEMWTTNLFYHIARLTKLNGTIATFTAAGFVRRGLVDAGFNMKKFKGFGRKREMVAGVLAIETNRDC